MECAMIEVYVSGQAGELAQERDRLDAELARLAEAIATGGHIPALLAALESKQTQRDTVAAKIEHAQGSEEAIRAALAAWQRRVMNLTLASVGGLGAALEAGESGRRLLGQMIRQPIVVTPRSDEHGKILGVVIPRRGPPGAAGGGARGVSPEYGTSADLVDHGSTPFVTAWELQALRLHRYWAVQPPSITSSLPVTNDDSSEARYSTP
jgi:hypothetical protein